LFEVSSWKFAFERPHRRFDGCHFSHKLRKQLLPLANNDQVFNIQRSDSAVGASDTIYCQVTIGVVPADVLADFFCNNIQLAPRCTSDFVFKLLGKSRIQ
jgi:hypothetical protein